MGRQEGESLSDYIVGYMWPNLLVAGVLVFCALCVVAVVIVMPLLILLGVDVPIGG